MFVSDMVCAVPLGFGPAQSMVPLCCSHVDRRLALVGGARIGTNSERFQSSARPGQAASKVPVHFLDKAGRDQSTQLSP